MGLKNSQLDRLWNSSRGRCLFLTAGLDGKCSKVDHHCEATHVGIKLSFDRVNLVVYSLADFLIRFDSGCTFKLCVEAITNIPVDERDVGTIVNCLDKV